LLTDRPGGHDEEGETRAGVAAIAAIPVGAAAVAVRGEQLWNEGALYAVAAGLVIVGGARLGRQLVASAERARAATGGDALPVPSVAGRRSPVGASAMLLGGRGSLAIGSPIPATSASHGAPWATRRRGVGSRWMR
jgi:hypothetical protein